MTLFNFKIINKKDTWVRTSSVSELQNLLNWSELIDTSFNYDAKEYIQMYKEDVAINLKDHYVSSISKIKKSTKIYEYKEVVLSGSDKSLEVKRLKKEINKLKKENFNILDKHHDLLIEGKRADLFDLNINLSKIKNIVKLIG